MVSIHQIAPYIGEDGSRVIQPEIPQGLRATQTTDTSIRWAWDALDGADSYRSEIRMGQDGEWIEAGPSSINTYNGAVGLTPNSAYYIRVRAVIGGISSEWSDLLMTATLLPVPGSVDNLRVHITGLNYVQWRWDSEPYATSYDWEFRPYNQNSLSSSGNAIITSYTRYGLGVGRRYQLRVRARHAAGMGPWSSWRSGDTLISAPTGFTLTQSNSFGGAIHLSWDSVEHASGYVVSGSTTQIDGVNFGEQTTSTTVARTISGGVTWAFRVQATRTHSGVTVSGNYANLSTSIYIPPPSISSFDISATDDGTNSTLSVSAEWADLPGADDYDFEVTVGDNVIFSQDNDPDDSVSFSVTEAGTDFVDETATFTIRSNPKVGSLPSSIYASLNATIEDGSLS